MKNRMTVAFIILMLLSVPVGASQRDELELKSSYGEDLTSVPYFLRLHYQNQTGMVWADVSYEERLVFLQEYETLRKAEEKQRKVDIKTELRQEKQRLRKKQAELKAKSAAIRAKRRAEKAKQREFDQRAKHFERKIEAQQKKIRAQRKRGERD